MLLFYNPGRMRLNFQNRLERKKTACAMFPRKPVTYLIEMSHAIPSQYILIGTQETHNRSYKFILLQKYSCFRQSTKTDLLTQKTFAFKTVSHSYKLALLLSEVR